MLQASLPPLLTKRKHHWKAQSMLDKEFKEIVAAEIISVTGGLVAGALLAAYIKEILLIPGIFVLLPGFLEMRGNISGALSARLTTALNLKHIPAKLRSKKTLKVVCHNISASFAQAVIVALALATVAYLVTAVIFSKATLSIFAIAVVAALFSNLIEASATIYATFWLFKRKRDPTNIIGPYVTTSGDIISILSLLFAILVVSWL